MSQSPAVLRQSQANMAKNSGDAHEWFRTVVDRFEGPLVRYAKSITGDTERGATLCRRLFCACTASLPSPLAEECRVRG